MAVLHGRPLSGARFPSSVTHTVKSSGSDSLAVNVRAIPIGGPENAGTVWIEFDDGRSVADAGVFVLRKTIQEEDLCLGRKRRGLAIGNDCTGTFFVAKVFRRRSWSNAPHCRRGMKSSGWPLSGPPGSILLFGPTGMSKVCFVFSIEVADQQPDVPVGLE